MPHLFFDIYCDLPWYLVIFLCDITSSPLSATGRSVANKAFSRFLQGFLVFVSVCIAKQPPNTCHLWNAPNENRVWESHIETANRQTFHLNIHSKYLKTGLDQISDTHGDRLPNVKTSNMCLKSRLNIIRVCGVF